ncbi:MAG TPA: hypothetical protein VK807_12500 [Gemmatimonadaceae bacterium]|jgi:hypothetical protein|nr:hypothetical protein [Gemmatimonadaceae bacterium]
MSDPSREFNPRAHGNIYTPHAGQMVIHVARESGLQSRTFVLSPGQVRLLRFFFRSRASRIGAVIALVFLALVITQAARVPMLNYRIAHMEHEAARLDTLERSLAELQKRYDQVQRMLGASVTPIEAFPAAGGDTLHRARSARAPRTNVDQAGSPTLAPGVSPTDEKTDSTAAPAPSKSADPMD